jgi:hypothetical protein
LFFTMLFLDFQHLKVLGVVRTMSSNQHRELQKQHGEELGAFYTAKRSALWQLLVCVCVSDIHATAVMLQVLIKLHNDEEDAAITAAQGQPDESVWQLSNAAILPAAGLPATTVLTSEQVSRLGMHCWQILAPDAHVSASSILRTRSRTSMRRLCSCDDGRRARV